MVKLTCDEAIETVVHRACSLTNEAQPLTASAE